MHKMLMARCKSICRTFFLTVSFYDIFGRKALAFVNVKDSYKKKCYCEIFYFLFMIKIDNINNLIPNLYFVMN